MAAKNDYMPIWKHFCLVKIEHHYWTAGSHQWFNAKQLSILWYIIWLSVLAGKNTMGNTILSICIMPTISYSPLTSIQFMSSINHSVLLWQGVSEINEFWCSEPKPIRVIIVREPPAEPPLRLRGNIAGDIEPWCRRRISLHNKSS